MTEHVQFALRLLESLGMECSPALTKTQVAAFGGEIVTEGIHSLVEATISGLNQNEEFQQKTMALSIAFINSDDGAVNVREAKQILGEHFQKQELHTLNELSAGLREISEMSAVSWQKTLRTYLNPESISTTDDVSSEKSPRASKIRFKEDPNLNEFSDSQHDPRSDWNPLQLALSSTLARNILKDNGGLDKLFNDLVTKNPEVDLLELILKLDINDMSSLHFAADHHTILFQLLTNIPENQRLNAVLQADSHGRTVLHHAAGNKDSIVQLLKLIAIDKRYEALTQLDSEGLSVFHHAKENPPALKAIMKCLTPEDFTETHRFLARIATQKKSSDDDNQEHSTPTPGSSSGHSS